MADGLAFRAATDADRDAWQRLVIDLPSGDILQDWAWAEVAGYDRQPMRRFVVEAHGEPVAVAGAQVRGTALGRSFWYVPHGPVLDYDHPEAGRRLATMVDGLREAAREDGGFVLRLEPRVEMGTPGAAHFDATGVHWVAETLQTPQTRMVELLDDDEALLASFDKDTRYAIRRAEREGVETRVMADPADDQALKRLHAMVYDTLRYHEYRLPELGRYRIIWRSFAGENRARIVEAWYGGRLESAALVIVAGRRSFYLYAGSVREEKGKTKRFPSYATQWQMMRTARELGSRLHDLWGVAPADAGPDHPWWGFSLFKRGFNGRYVQWIGSREQVLHPLYHGIRETAFAIRNRLPGRAPPDPLLFSSGTKPGR
jgi:lipid II:glycine glycyltransferase (peptidoglycan interpeptide bridge formation enzyme)